ncbi:MAG: Cro/Cl family transcriptional regulator [Actinobacteria bacterium]|nr:Cro/Cl family transcriptional regulator [Actinomycetota bacterium]
MNLAACVNGARRDESVARLRRALAIRAMAANGMSQQAIARELGVSQPAVSQALAASARVSGLDLELVLEAVSPVLKVVAEQRGFSDLAVFGSVARGEAGPESDVDLIVRPPSDAQIADMVSLAQIFSEIVGRHVDVISYGALKEGVDDDIRSEMVRL